MSQLIVALVGALLAVVPEGACPLQGHMIVVDPGHGGSNPGAVVRGILEKTLVLRFSEQLYRDLGREGAWVVLTRSSDINLFPAVIEGPEQRRSLQARVELAERTRADLCLSIHANMYRDPSARGAQVFVGENPSPERQRLAECLEKALAKETGSRRRVDSGTPLYLMRHPKIPAALIEIGFMTNPDEAKLMQDPAYRERLSKAIVRGVTCFYRDGSAFVASPSQPGPYRRGFSVIASHACGQPQPPCP